MEVRANNLWDNAFEVPGYKVTERGLVSICTKEEDGEKKEIEDIITEAPFWYHAAYMDLDTSEAQIELRYVADKTLHKFLIPRSLFYSQGWLSKLAGRHKLPIHPLAHKVVANYLYKADMACTEVGYTSTHAGWQKLPNGAREYVPFGNVRPNPLGEGTKKRFSFIRKNGEKIAWYKRIFSVLEKNPLAVIPFAGSLAAPILSLIDSQSVVIDIHNTSSSGKTIAGLMAMSVWGKPDQLKINWDSTKVALEQNASAFSDLPLFFDESQLNTYPKDIGVSIYNVANGMGRERGAAGGGTRLTGSWSTVLISTGEQSLLSLIPQNFSGLDARIIPVEGKTLGNLNAKQAQGLAIFLKNNYGFLSQDYVDHLKNTNGQKLGERYAYYVDMLQPWVYPGDAIQMRKAETYAPLLLAIEQLYVVLPLYRGQIDTLWFSVLEFWKQLCKNHQNKQVAQLALRILKDFISAKEPHFRNDENNPKERYGTIYKNQEAILPTVLEKLFSSHKLSTENVLREFKERGWLQLDSKGGMKVKTTFGMGKEQKRFYALTQSAQDAYEKDHIGLFVDQDESAIEAWTKAIDAGALAFEDTLSDEDIIALDIGPRRKKLNPNDTIEVSKESDTKEEVD